MNKNIENNRKTLILVKSYLNALKKAESSCYDLCNGSWVISVRISDDATIGEAKKMKAEFMGILDHLGVEWDAYPEDNSLESWCFDISNLQC